MNEDKAKTLESILVQTCNVLKSTEKSLEQAQHMLTVYQGQKIVGLLPMIRRRMEYSHQHTEEISQLLHQAITYYFLT